MKRAPMRKIREALRLRASGMSTREMASSLSVGRTTLREYLSRANRAGLAWPLSAELSDVDLETHLFPLRKGDNLGAIPQPDWAYVHAELRRKGGSLFRCCGKNIEPFIRMAMATADIANFTLAGKASYRR